MDSNEPISGGLLAEPRSIMQTLTGKFQPGPDVAAIQSINEAFAKIQIARAQKLAASRDVLHQWMKKVEGAKWEAQRPADRSEASQEERMSHLERERIALAKSVNELEMAIQREEMIQVQLQERASTIQRRLLKVEGEEGQLGEDRIRATVYRDLGVTWIWEEPTLNTLLKGSLTNNSLWQSLPLKCRVVNRKRNDVFTLSFAPLSGDSLGGSFLDAQAIWQALGL